MTGEDFAALLGHGRLIGHRRTAIETAPADLPDRAAALAGAGLRLALVAAHDDSTVPSESGAPLRAVYLYTGSEDRRVELHVCLDRAEPVVPTLAHLSFPASRFEREMHDLYGIQPAGHPLPRRLVRHGHWPAGWYPMRHDAGPPPRFGESDQPFPFLTVEGRGVYEIPVGPVHAGLIEPGHFRFSVVGETILKLKARLWYVHKGIERLFEGREPVAGIALAERISGDTAVGHALAYCRAVEDALGARVSAPAERVRSVLLGLERLYNHIGDIGALCNDVGHSILNAHALRIRERLLRLNHCTTGHRLLRGGVVIGGAVVRRLPERAELAEIAADIREVVDLAAGNSLVAERFTGTAVLGTEQARDLGALGYVARASGIDVDARRDHPAPGVDVPAMTMPVRTGGDVLARFQQRAAELEVSFRHLDALIADAGAAGEPVNAGPPWAGPLPAGARSGVGIVEGWRGTIVHRVEIGPDGRLTRTKVVDPSFFNWPALPLALANTIVPDFPLANKSFNLSYAGNDL